MGQVLGPDNIPNVVKAGGTSLSFAATNNGQPTRITVGGQQYTLSQPIAFSALTSGFNGLDTGSLGSSQTWYLYAVVQSGSLGLLASLSSIPSGFSAYKLIGAFFTNYSSLIGKSIDLLPNGRPNYFAISSVGKLTGSNQTLSTGISNLVNINTVHSDPFGLLDTTNKRFYSPVSGLYKVSMGMFLRNGTGGVSNNSPNGPSVYKNGNPEALGIGYGAQNIANGDYYYTTATFDVALAAGDYIEARLYSQTANWQVVTFDNNSNYTHCALELVSPA